MVVQSPSAMPAQAVCVKSISTRQANQSALQLRSGKIGAAIRSWATGVPPPANNVTNGRSTRSAKNQPSVTPVALPALAAPPEPPELLELLELLDMLMPLLGAFVS